MVAFQSSLMLSTRDLRSHMVFKTSFPVSSTKHWPVKTVTESVGTGQEMDVSTARAAGQCQAVTQSRVQQTQAVPALWRHQ